MGGFCYALILVKHATHFNWAFSLKLSLQNAFWWLLGFSGLRLVLLLLGLSIVTVIQHFLAR